MRLIDADALKLYIDKEVAEDKVLDGWAFFFKAYLDNAPSIDIVRCEECKFNGIWCDIQDIQWNGYDKPVEWCSYGEREGE